MLPYAHLAAGYLLSSMFVRATRHRSIERRETLFVVIGTQLPDLIDKPLALFIGGAFASGRTVGHSLLFAVPLTLGLGAALGTRHRSAIPTLAFAIGYLSHPFLDASVFVVQGTLLRDFLEVGFVLWPVGLPADAIIRFLESSPAVAQIIEAKPHWTARHLPSGERLRWCVRAVELTAVLAAMLLWLADGAPGVELIRD